MRNDVRSAATIEVAGREGGIVALTEKQLDNLSWRLDGPLLHADSAGWNDAVLIWNGMVATSPALVVQPTSSRDVAAVVDFARAHKLVLSIKAGGHNIGGTAIAEQGLTLDMSRLRSVTVDPDAKVVHVGPGCLLADVDRATQQHGLATVLGFVSQVGVAGLTLGGGLGYLVRRFGWTVDNLEEVEIVTADGGVRVASRSMNAELFWALRGGGGNFGVVTRFTFRLHQVGPTVYGGLIGWPFERAAEILAAYRRLTAGAPRELSVWMTLLRAPAAPFVPTEWHGKRICAMSVCYSGTLDKVDAVMAPIRTLGGTVVDLLRERPYVDLQSYLDETEPKGDHYYWKTAYAAELSDGLLSTLQELYAACPIPDAQLGLLHVGGALNEHDWDDGAVGNRDARFVWGVLGAWRPDEPDADAFRRWIREGWERMRPYSTGGSYVNFQPADDDAARIAEAYGKNFARLQRAKAHYDPENLFRVNRNILPMT